MSKWVVRAMWITKGSEWKPTAQLWALHLISRQKRMHFPLEKAVTMLPDPSSAGCSVGVGEVFFLLFPREWLGFWRSVYEGQQSCAWLTGKEQTPWCQPPNQPALLLPMVRHRPCQRQRGGPEPVQIVPRGPAPGEWRENNDEGPWWLLPLGTVASGNEVLSRSHKKSVSGDPCMREWDVLVRFIRIEIKDCW